MRYALALLLALFLFQMPSDVRAEEPAKVRKSNTIVESGGYEYYSHRVRRGETVYAIAVAYQVSEASIIEKNPFVVNGIKPRQTILVPTEETFKVLEKKKEARTGEQKGKPRERDESTVKEHKKITYEKVDSLFIAENDSVVDEEILPDDLILSQTRHFNPREGINVTLILPLDEQQSRSSGVNFLNGALLALETLKNEGISVDLQLISLGTEKNSKDKAERIIRSGALDKTDIIIGPVYQEDFSCFVDWANKNRVPIVSPLDVIGDIRSPFVFQATPDERHKYEKLQPLLNDENSHVIVMLTGTSTDQEFLDELKPFLPSDVYIMANVQPFNLSIFKGFERNKENVVIIPVKVEHNKGLTESLVAAIIEKIHLQNSGRYNITIIAQPSWDNFGNINTNLLYRYKAQYITNYHEYRDDDVMYQFYSRYMDRFGAVPSRSSMRGYDVILYFVSAMAEFGPKMPLKISNYNMDLLQVKYRFEQDDEHSSFINREWPLVEYRPDNKIIVR